jgi:DNA-binding response OmpR family regulator
MDSPTSFFLKNDQKISIVEKERGLRNMGAKILIVEDEKKMAQFLMMELEHEGYEVQVVYNGREAMELIQSDTFDVILLDIMLPGINGMEVCRRVRQFSEVPIIMVTAKADVTDRVMGLDTGANDYLTKPFAIEELLARIRAIQRNHQKVSDDVLQVGNLMMNTKTHEVVQNGENVSLTKKEYDLLEMLLRNKGIVLTRDRLLESLWGYEYSGDTNVIDVFIKHLRNKLDKDQEGSVITTVRGVGYVIKGEKK